MVMYMTKALFTMLKKFQSSNDLYSYGICDFTTQKAIRQAVLDTTFLIDKQLEEAVSYMDK